MSSMTPAAPSAQSAAPSDFAQDLELDQLPAAEAAHSAALSDLTQEPVISAALADFALNLKLDRLPAELVRKAKNHMLDGIGIALASSGFEFAGPILDGARRLGNGTDAHALASGAPLPAAGAALVNGTLIHGLDFDDTHIGAIYHATAPALASSLAVGESAGVNGREFLTSFIAALEIGCRLGKAANGKFHELGFHATALCGAFAAAFASGRLLGGDASMLVSASGLCGSMAAGVLELEGSWLKRMHPGWAAHSGVAAASLAVSGFKGPPTMFEGPRGFYKTHIGAVPAGAAAPHYRLNQDWLIAGIALKPYPCCHFIHSFVDCALVLRTQVALDQIERIVCPLSQRIHPLVSGPARPTEPYAAMFSVPYVVALALVTGKADLTAFFDKGTDDPAVLALSERATCVDDLASDFPVHFPGEVRITLKNGETVSHRVPTSYGTPDRPLDPADIEAKFMANATRVMQPDRAEALMRMVQSVETIAHVSELMRACVV